MRLTDLLIVTSRSLLQGLHQLFSALFTEGMMFAFLRHTVLHLSALLLSGPRLQANQAIFLDSSEAVRGRVGAQGGRGAFLSTVCPLRAALMYLCG